MRKTLVPSSIPPAGCTTPNDQAQMWVGRPTAEMMASRRAPDFENRVCGGRALI